MAEIRKIVPRPALSDFRPIVNPGPSAFSTLADLAQTAADWLEPAATKQLQDKATQEWTDYARGGRTVAPSGASTDPGASSVPVDPNSPQGLASDAMAALGKGPEKYRNAIASIESAGSGDYSAVGPTNAKMGRALGRYQIMEANIGPWSKEALGREVTVDEFMANPSIQDAIFDHKFGGYVAQFGERGAAEAWFAGPGGVGKSGRTDALGTSVGTYGDKFTAALGGTVSASSSGQPTVYVRTSEGKVEPRLYSPLSGPMLQAANAAAGVAYISEKMVQGQTDLISMAGQFSLDPQGFQQAAEAYIGQMVQDAPEQFRTDLMTEMRGEAQKSFLGIVEDQQKDTRQRAANSSAALVDRWSGDYAEALASGDMDAAAKAEEKLRGVLRAREALPSLSWTPEQSDNVILDAQDAAAKAVEKQRKDAESGLKDQLNTIIDAAKAGMTAADEAILQNPMVQQMLPDLWREATAFTTLRDQIPTFNTMTPGQQRAALAEMEAQPVTADWETDLYSAAGKVAADNAKKWKADPIKRAGEVLTDDPPPPLPDLDPSNPEAFMSALGERATYATRLADAGYTDRKVFLSKDEAKTVGALFGKDVPPEVKAMAAGAVVSAMGLDAAGFFAQIKTDDPIIPHVGALMASGGDTTVAVEAMTGQMYLDNKTVPAPSAKAVAAGRASFDAALRSIPGIAEGMDGITKTATAIYAARVPADADEDTQATIMKEAWQAALGQSNDLGVLRGGVQDIGGQQVLLPPTVSGEDMSKAMDAAFGFKPSAGFWSFDVSSTLGRQSEGISPDLWKAAAGGIPSLGGEPISADLWENGEITMTPVGGSKYMLTVNRNGVTIDVGVQGEGPDVPFIFDAEALIEASLVPK